MIFDDLMVLSEELTIPKPLFFHKCSTTFSDPFPDPPREELFGPFWSARVPIYTHRVDFEAFLAPPWGPKTTLGPTRVGQNGENGSDFFQGSPGVALGAPFSPKVSRACFFKA